MIPALHQFTRYARSVANSAWPTISIPARGKAAPSDAPKGPQGSIGVGSRALNMGPIGPASAVPVVARQNAAALAVAGLAKSRPVHAVGWFAAPRRNDPRPASDRRVFAGPTLGIELRMRRSVSKDRCWLACARRGLDHGQCGHIDDAARRD